MATEDQPPSQPPTSTDDNVDNQQPQTQPPQAPQPPAPSSSTPETAQEQQEQAPQQVAAPSTAPLPPSTTSQPPQPQPPPPTTTTTTTSTTPASPPLPTRHTAATPGPRAQRFQEMFDLALSRTLTRISPDNFASCYPTIAAQAPHILRQVQRAMVDRFAELCGQGFADALARYAVVARLNELEALVSDAERRRRGARAADRKAWKGKAKEREAGVGGGGGVSGDDAKRAAPTPPHMLPAEVVLAAHLAPHLASQQGQMNARLQNAQAANAALWDEIQAQRAEVEELLGALEGALADVDGAAALMDGVPAEELARESRAVEAEMADA